MSDIELSPCPFCGGDAHVVHDAGWFRAQCKQCGTSVGEFRRSGEVAPAWNRRASDPLTAELVGALKRMHQAFNAKKPLPKHEGDALEAMCRALLAKGKKQEEGSA